MKHGSRLFISIVPIGGTILCLAVEKPQHPLPHWMRMRFTPRQQSPLLQN